MRHALSPALAAAVLLAACGGSDDAAPAPDAPGPEAGDAAAPAPAYDIVEQPEFQFSADVYPAPGTAERTAAFLAANAAREGVMVTESGLQYEIIEAGDGEGGDVGGWPDRSEPLKISYEGFFIDGLQFDGSAEGEPLEIDIERMFDGLKEGLRLMGEGDRYRFFIPPDLAFGEAGTPGGPVRPNEALVYEVSLVDVLSEAERAAAEEAEEAAAVEEQAALDAALEASKAFIAEIANKDGVVRTESGVVYEILKEGPDGGASPAATDKVTVHYEGTLPDGTVFDSSYERGQPATFGLNQVIPGWTEGVQLMSEGDKFKFYLPPELAYGERGAGDDIGPNQALVFEVELIKVGEPE